jgi:small subunit ribosomal protein S2
MEIKKNIEDMFAIGAHFGLGRSRRHPTVASYIFGTKNDTDIFDLEKTEIMLEKAKAFVTSLAKDGKSILFVGGKKEASSTIKNAACSLNMPYVDSRWIGGSLSNFTQMRKRIDRYEKLVSDKEKGELAKYTKRERMLLDKEIASLEKMFLGIVSMKKLPSALFIIDPRYEKIAVKEAALMNIPVVALSNSDCNLLQINYPIIGNDASKASIQFFVEEIVKAYKAGKLLKV